MSFEQTTLTKEEEIKALKDLVVKCHRAMMTCIVSDTPYGNVQSFSRKRIREALSATEEVVIDHVAESTLEVLDNMKMNKHASRLNA